MTKFDWTNIDNIQKLLNVHTSRRAVLVAMGYHRNSYYASRKLNFLIKQHNLVTDFRIRKMPDRYKNLPSVVPVSFSYAEVMRAVGLADVGDNNKTVRKYIKELDLDVSHFVSSNKLPTNKIPNDKLFVKSAVRRTSVVRTRIIKENIKEYRCVSCGVRDTWNDKPITLQLEHKNGDNTDNRLENLEFLCPNCHSQTDTWGSKGHKKITKK